MKIPYPVLAVSACLAMPGAYAASTLQGTIASYECGDNCYLNITDDAGGEHSGLCTASLCDPWNEAAEMPADFVGKRVKVKVGTGTQVDGSGNNMGEMDSFDEITLLDDEDGMAEESAADETSHCNPDESSLFSCKLTNGKTVSLCASTDLAPDSGYLQYRFGKLGKVELSLPAKARGIPKELTLSHSKDDSAEYNSVSFMNGENYIYELTSFRQFKARNKDGVDTPESSDTLTVRDQRKSMREGDIVFNGECAELGDNVDAVAISDMTGVKWERAGF
jgi:hypothetical protein